MLLRERVFACAQCVCEREHVSIFCFVLFCFVLFCHLVCELERERCCCVSRSLPVHCVCVRAHVKVFFFCRV